MYKLTTTYKKLLSDTITPVGIYLKLRDKFPNSILLESSDYHGSENSFSYICCKPIASIKIENNTVYETYPDGEKNNYVLNSDVSVPEVIQQFSQKFDVEKSPFKFIHNGLFGYISYDSVKYFEEIEIDSANDEQKNIPDIFYSVYRYVIAINHFKDELYLFEYRAEGDEKSEIELLESFIKNKNHAQYSFVGLNNEESNFTDKEFVDIIKRGKEHCQKGDVFQIVLSRLFSQKFRGDELNVYRALRSVNPSPYLFYFDYGNFKIFGSSPEAQIVIGGGNASIYPIAGTFRRTGDDEADALLAEKLKNDPKENAEHVMLVDLARNDLSRNCYDVKVEKFREIQYYSHVIHLVSKVSGKINKDVSAMKIVADTFPAGTLSGAPKHKAMQLINQYEKNGRGFYGGCIGFLGFNGDFNHAIMIRSFLSKDNHLYYRAGAGVVVSSNEESELNEVNNKLLALKKAIELAKEL